MKIKSDLSKKSLINDRNDDTPEPSEEKILICEDTESLQDENASKVLVLFEKYTEIKSNLLSVGATFYSVGVESDDAYIGELSSEGYLNIRNIENTAGQVSALSTKLHFYAPNLAIINFDLFGRQFMSDIEVNSNTYSVLFKAR